MSILGLVTGCFDASWMNAYYSEYLSADPVTRSSRAAFGLSNGLARLERWAKSLRSNRTDTSTSYIFTSTQVDLVCR